MTRELALIAIAMAAGTDYDRAAALVDELSPSLPSDAVAAGKAIATAVNATTYRI